MSLISKVLHVGETLFSHKGGQAPQLTPEDNKAVQQIRAAHSPDANIVVNEKAILIISQQILNGASPSALLDPKAISEAVDDKANQNVISDAFAFTIHKIGCELCCNCTGEGDLKGVTLSVFNTLVKYAWDAKVTLALAAFAASYGEFCLLSQLHGSNTLAKYVYLLKPLPDVSEREALIIEVLKAVIDVAKCIIELIDLPTQYISPDRSPLSDALTHIPAAAYCAIKSIVACSFQSIGLINVGHQYAVSITEARKKLTELTQTLKSYHVLLANQLELCHKHINFQMENQDFVFVTKVIEATHTNSMEVFKAIIQTEENLPLFNGVNKKKVGLDVLKGKTVIFFFSKLDISNEEIQEIVQQAGKSDRKYEIVWIPVIDVVITSEMKQEILRKSSLMPWFSLHYSIALRPGVIKYIKEKWLFEKKPLLVVFNAQGRISCQNAYHLLMTWGSQAFPFDTQREQTLWQGTTWSLHFLVDESDKTQLIKEEKFVFFYGGEDIEWIRKFTSGVKGAVKGEGIILELIYVGRKQSIIEAITKENLSKCWDLLKYKRFRARLESIMCSKMKQGKTFKNDPVMKAVMIVLGALDSGREWTIISHGSKDMITMNSEMAMVWLEKFKEVNVKLTFENFISIVIQVITTLESDVPGPTTPPNGGDGVPCAPIKKHCNHIEVPSTGDINQESMVCVDCHRPMEKVVVFKCCVD